MSSYILHASGRVTLSQVPGTLDNLIPGSSLNTYSNCLNKIRNALTAFEYCYKNTYTYGAFVTLNFPDSFTCYDRYHQRALFTDYIRKRIKRKSLDYAYVSVTEKTFRNRIHFHFLFCANGKFDFVQAARDYGLLRGIPNIVDIAYIERNKEMSITYLTKYLNKMNSNITNGCELLSKINWSKNDVCIRTFIKGVLTYNTKHIKRLWTYTMPYHLKRNVWIEEKDTKIKMINEDVGIKIYTKDQFHLLRKKLMNK